MKGIVYEPIRVMFKEHLHDEYFHSNFLAPYLKLYGLNYIDKEKEIMGQNLIDAMNVFAEPRTDIYFYLYLNLDFLKKLYPNVLMIYIIMMNGKLKKQKKNVKFIKIIRYLWSI